MMDMLMAASGRATSAALLPSSLKALRVPLKVAIIEIRERVAAACMTCLRRASLYPSAPRIINGIPKQAGMRAVILCLPVRI